MPHLLTLPIEIRLQILHHVYAVPKIVELCQCHNNYLRHPVSSLSRAAALRKYQSVQEILADLDPKVLLTCRHRQQEVTTSNLHTRVGFPQATILCCWTTVDNFLHEPGGINVNGKWRVETFVLRCDFTRSLLHGFPTEQEAMEKIKASGRGLVEGILLHFDDVDWVGQDLELELDDIGTVWEASL